MKRYCENTGSGGISARLSLMLFAVTVVFTAAAAYEIPESIRQIRMGTVNVKTDPGAVVRVSQLRHEFWFGTCISNFAGIEDSLQSESRRIYNDTLARYFNTAVHENALKWEQLTDRWGSPWTPNYTIADTILNWCEANDMKMRGHCMFWANKGYVPDWAKALSDDSLRLAVKEHIFDMLPRYRGRIDEWDFNNEMLHHDYFRSRLGDDIIDSMLIWSKQANPDAILYLNDYSILAGGKDDNYVKQVRGFLERGLPVGGIGCQGHFGSGVGDTAKLRKELDSLGQFGIPIKITEMDISTDDEEKQAQEFSKILPLAFSHEAVNGVLLWGFWEDKMWRSKGALWLEDWTPVSSAAVWKDFIYSKWWTEVIDTADENGDCAIPAFFGRHRIEVEGATGEDITLAKADGEVTVEIKATNVSSGRHKPRSGPSIRRMADRIIIYGVSTNLEQFSSVRMYSPDGRSVSLPVKSRTGKPESGICIGNGVERLSPGMYFLKIPGAEPISILLN